MSKQKSKFTTLYFPDVGVKKRIIAFANAKASSFNAVVIEVLTQVFEKEGFEGEGKARISINTKKHNDAPQEKVS